MNQPADSTRQKKVLRSQAGFALFLFQNQRKLQSRKGCTVGVSNVEVARHRVTTLRFATALFLRTIRGDFELALEMAIVAAFYRRVHTAAEIEANTSRRFTFASEALLGKTPNGTLTEIARGRDGKRGLAPLMCLASLITANHCGQVGNVRFTFCFLVLLQHDVPLRLNVLFPDFFRVAQRWVFRVRIEKVG